eukprot:6008451-Pyramimonas_sp.AAC.1
MTPPSHLNSVKLAYLLSSPAMTPCGRPTGKKPHPSVLAGRNRTVLASHRGALTGRGGEGGVSKPRPSTSARH